MMTTTAPSTSGYSQGLADAHGSERSKWHFGFTIAFLALGFLVDFAQFWQVVGRAVPDLTGWAITLIAVGAGAVALYTMFEAGRLEAERRQTTMGRHGRGMVRLLVGVWLFLGFVATYIRLTVAPDQSVSGFGTAATDRGFGAATAAEATWQLGPLTLHPAELPMALLMLALYLAVGIGAYLFGLRSHRPAGTDLRRARRQERSRQRKLRRMTEARDQQAEVVLRLKQDVSEAQEERQAMHSQATLDAALRAHAAATSRQADLTAEAARVRHELHAIATELETLDSTVQAHKDLADAVGSTARHHARSRLHQHLGDPARTVKDGDVLTFPTAPTLEP